MCKVIQVLKYMDCSQRALKQGFKTKLAGKHNKEHGGM